MFYLSDDCPASFHHDLIKAMCIRVFDVPATWDDADNVCKNYSQRLININTPSQVTILKEYLQSKCHAISVTIHPQHTRKRRIPSHFYQPTKDA